MAVHGLPSKCQQGCIPSESPKEESTSLPFLELLEAAWIPWLMATSLVFKASNSRLSLCQAAISFKFSTFCPPLPFKKDSGDYMRLIQIIQIIYPDQVSCWAIIIPFATLNLLYHVIQQSHSFQRWAPGYGEGALFCLPQLMFFSVSKDDASVVMSQVKELCRHMLLSRNWHTVTV